MKKVLVICLTLVMVMCMSVSALATSGAFVSSPSGNPAPLVIAFESADEDCTATLVLTPYGEKSELSGAILTMFEQAYDEIAESGDLTKLNAEFAKLVADKKIDSENLAISDLFDIHVTGCEYHEEHADFDITLDADTLSHFVALLHMNKDGVWELVNDAKVVNNGEHLTFSVDSFSPFAIVVDTSAGTSDAPQANNALVYICVAAAAVIAVAVVLIVMKNKKQKAA